MRIAVVGATGLVGGKVLELLSGAEWSDHQVDAFATTANGRTVNLGDRSLPVQAMPDNAPEVDFAFLAVPNATAKHIVPIWIKAGVRIIDKSSAYRMDPSVPLVVPEINGHLITSDSFLIANPNCSTIQLAVAVEPLRKVFGLQQVRVATYQAVSGAGSEAVNAWREEVGGRIPSKSPFPEAIHGNVIPAIGTPDEKGWYTEERKVMEELPKILGQSDLKVTCTAVRVPVEIGHSEAVEITCEKEVNLDGVLSALAAMPGVTVLSEEVAKQTPLHAAGKDEVFVGRVRLDPYDPRTVHLWVVSDNLRKGAATNAVQILRRWMETVKP
ncbi:MAG: aspartate-semialdehyde dehydrogenase [bacterium]